MCDLFNVILTANNTITALVYKCTCCALEAELNSLCGFRNWDVLLFDRMLYRIFFLTWYLMCMVKPSI